MNDVARDVVDRPEIVRDLAVAVDSADWSSVTRIVREGWFDLVRNDAADHARVIFAKVPAAVFRHEPLLAMEYGILLNQTRFHRFRALRLFVTAVRAARSPRNTDLGAVDRFLIRASESAAFRLLGRTEASATAARAALEQAASLTDDERGSISDLPRVFATLGQSFYYARQYNDALRAAALGLAEASTEAPSDGMGALALLCGIYTLRGDMPQAAEYLEYARTGPWTDRDRDSYSGIFYRIAEAYAALEASRPDDARDHLNRLYAMTGGRHASEHWALIAETDALIELVAGQPARGLAALDEMVELRGAEVSPRARARLARIRSLLHLALGNPDGAIGVLKRDKPDEVVVRIESARVALALGRTNSALGEMRVLAKAQLSTRQSAEVAAMDVAVLLRLSPTPRRDAAIQRLGTLLERSGQSLALALIPPADLERVCAALAAAGFSRGPADTDLRSLLPDLEPAGLLSRREAAVLNELARTGSVSDVAAALVVSSNTVKSQIRSVYRKLGVSNREDALAVASERHLLRD